MPAGHISESPENRVNQVNRRMSKMETIRAELDSDDGQRNYHYGPEEADYGIMTFGSQQGTAAEAVDALNEAGESVKLLGVSELAPYPVEEVAEFVESVEEVLVVEMNASAQFRGLTQKELGRYGEKLSSLLKYNGNPFEPGEIVEGFRTSIVEDGALPGHETKFVPAAGD
jgi:pyruvate ferredoxin oxidoreductase alpha subunit